MVAGVAVLDTVWMGLKDAFLMAWEVWWALVLGFAISAIVQLIVAGGDPLSTLPAAQRAVVDALEIKVASLDPDAPRGVRDVDGRLTAPTSTSLAAPAPAGRCRRCSTPSDPTCTSTHPRTQERAP